MTYGTLNLAQSKAVYSEARPAACQLQFNVELDGLNTTARRTDDDAAVRISSRLTAAGQVGKATATGDDRR